MKNRVVILAVVIATGAINAGISSAAAVPSSSAQHGPVPMAFRCC